MPKENDKNVLKLALLGVTIVVTLILILKLNPGIPGVPVEAVNTIAPVKVDSSILGNQKFKELRGYGQYPVRPGKMGRQNPFIPPTKIELNGADTILPSQ